MRVLVFHGYLLRGTGSNVYNAALGEAFVRAGHELHLLCQDRAPLEFPWVDAAGDWDEVLAAEHEATLKALDCALVRKPFDIDMMLNEVRRALGDPYAGPRTAARRSSRPRSRPTPSPRRSAGRRH
mgnify:CR=1 FL=1